MYLFASWPVQVKQLSCFIIFPVQRIPVPFFFSTLHVRCKYLFIVILWTIKISEYEVRVYVTYTVIFFLFHFFCWFDYNYCVNYFLDRSYLEANQFILENRWFLYQQNWNSSWNIHWNKWIHDVSHYFEIVVFSWYSTSADCISTRLQLQSMFGLVFLIAYLFLTENVYRVFNIEKKLVGFDNGWKMFLIYLCFLLIRPHVIYKWLKCILKNKSFSHNH